MSNNENKIDDSQVKLINVNLTESTFDSIEADNNEAINKTFINDGEPLESNQSNVAPSKLDDVANVKDEKINVTHDVLMDEEINENVNGEKQEESQYNLDRIPTEETTCVRDQSDYDINKTGKRRTTKTTRKDTLQDGSSSYNYQNSKTSPAARSSASVTNSSLGTTSSAFNISLRNEKKISAEHIKTVFHVHLPLNVKELGVPVIVGNIKELGSWNDPIVKLHQISRRTPPNCSNTYWVSDPVSISLKNLESIQEIRYKYVIVPSQLTTRKTKDFKTMIYEGFDDTSERVLLLRENQYDIWKNNEFLNISQVKDYYFAELIFNSLTPENLKEKIIEYQSIYSDRDHWVNAIHAVSIEFFRECLHKKNSREHRLLVLIFMGYYIHGIQRHTHNRVELPEKFPTHLLLDILEYVQEDTFPSDMHKIVMTACVTLIRHNISKGEFTWIKIFPVAKLLDPDFKFLESLKFRFDEKATQSFLYNLRDKAFNYIDQIKHSEPYANVGKWLISKCETMESLMYVWQNIIIDHTEDVNILLRHTLLERVQKNIQFKYDIVQLHKLFIELPPDFSELVAEAFRKRIIIHLKNGLGIPNYPSKHSEAIFQLLKSENLFWTSDDYIIVLELFSQFTDIEMLCHFHQLLDNFQDENEDIKERKKVFKICKKWYECLLNRLTASSHKQDTIFLIFYHASLLYERIGKHTILWEKIMELAAHSIKQFPESLIFKALPKIEKLHADVVGCFSQIVEEMLSASTKHIDDLLMIRIKHICASSGEQLVIPSLLSENFICHIIECLQISLPSYDADLDTIPTSFHLSLLNAADFWKMILRAKGCTKELNSLHYITKIKQAISQLGCNIINESIDIFLLQNIYKYDDDFLLKYFESVSIFDEDVKIHVTKEILESVKKQIREYMQTFENLNAFYVRYCSVTKVTDGHEYLDYLNEQKNMWESISLDQIRGLETWKYHYEILEVAKKIYKYNKSQTFYNVFEKILQEIPNEINVQTLVQVVIPEVFKSYIKYCSKFQNWEDIQLSFATMFWKNVKDINAELEFMVDYPMNQDPRYTMTLTHLSEILKLTQKLHQLSTVVEIFNVPRNEQDWLSEALNNLEEQSIFLGHLSAIFDSVNKYIGTIDENTNGWSLIKELSIAEEFINFLRSVAEHDLKNLINGVDDHSDERLIQEDTVSSLIQVKQFLIPLMNAASTLTLDTFVQELLKIAELNPTLSRKVTLCNSNNMALQNMYANISNRGEVTKEKIQNSVKIGTYKFEWKSADKRCSVKLSYPITKTRTVTYNFNDLQDLRGRALLIAKPDITIGDSNKKDKTKDIMDEFVNQVDIAQDIVNNIASKLIETGHFGYREFQDSVKGTEKMIQLAEKLKADLKKW
ncbi:1628_t:CDS:2 [Scutellospora calospora]|uniref:1628_t:CDS:1 n=1 Tax=Scutellospora calospora TaxID=85575 RepID=A0ACA9LJ68_9GLOM|nr:1628_t:CDS:2 [Scutellospora calospora]